jgi:molybdenum cofactor biosynthesis protein MoaC
MIDVSDKEKTARVARARATVKVGKKILQKIKNHQIPKGDVVATATVAGIVAAKKVPTLIPLCHPIEIEQISIDFGYKNETVVIEATVKSIARTGVEMEALTAASMAALTVYDMCKMFSQSIEISSIYLLEKRGGKSGTYRRDKSQGIT